MSSSGLSAQALLYVAKRVAKRELQDSQWIHRVARITRQTYEDARVLVLNFLDRDVFHISNEKCMIFLESLVRRWDIEFDTFSMEVALNRHLTDGCLKKLEIREAEPEKPEAVEPGLLEFLEDKTLSAGISDDEIAFLKRLSLNGQRPSRFYYYRELQNLRDPLNFDPQPGTRKMAPARSSRSSRSNTPSQWRR